MRRIAFTGASGTGKSTLAERIARQLALPLCPVGSRDTALAMGFGNPYDVDAAGKRASFQSLLLERKHAWEMQNVIGFVTDRTHSDNFTYTMMHARQLAEDPVFADGVRKANGTYTHVVFCPMRSFHNLANDPMRVSERAYHEQYERILFDALSVHCPVLLLLATDLDERFHQVLRFIST